MCIQFFLLSLKLIKFKTPAQIQVGLKIQTWSIASDIFTLFFLAPFLLQYEQFNTFQRPRDMQLFWCLQLRRNNASDLKQIFLWLKPVSNEGLFMVYELGWESKNSAHTSLKKLPLFIGKVSLYNSPNPPPFCREGLLCPGSTREHCVKQMCKLLSSPAVGGFWFARNQSPSRHMSWEAPVLWEKPPVLPICQILIISYETQPCNSFLPVTRKCVAFGRVSPSARRIRIRLFPLLRENMSTASPLLKSVLTLWVNKYKRLWPLLTCKHCEFCAQCQHKSKGLNLHICVDTYTW